jgi:hypothetical protein
MVKSTSSLIGLIVVFISFGESIAQSTERDVVDQRLEWFALNSNIKFHKRAGLAFDSQLRYAGSLQSAQNYVRLGLDLYITPKLSIVPVGGMYVWNYKYGEQPAAYANDEKRIWQQVLYKHDNSRFHFNHRFRMEERFIQNKKSGNDAFSTELYRVRYRFQANIGLNKEKLEPGAFYLSIWDEFFYGWGKGDTFNKIDQNRFSVALGYQVAPKVSFTVGALYQMMVKKNGAQQENNTGIIVQFNYNFDFSKKEN